MAYTIRTDKSDISGTAQSTKRQTSGSGPALKGSGSSAYNEYLLQQAAKNTSAASGSSGNAASGNRSALNGSGSSAYNEYLLQQAAKNASAASGSKSSGAPGSAAVAASTASSASGQTGSGSGSSGSGSYDLTEYIRRQQAAALEAKLAGLESAYKVSLAAYDAAAERLPQIYNTARNAAAAQTALSRQGFDERAAASGLSSGAAAQAELARDSVYRGTLAGIDQEQIAAQNEIELAKANLRNQYQTAIVQARASGDSNLASALYQELVRVQGLDRDDARYAQKLALDYGMTPGASLGSIGSINSLSDLAGLIYKAGSQR